MISFLTSNTVHADLCPLKESIQNEILVGFATHERETMQYLNNKPETTVVGNFRIIASIHNSKIVENDGSTIKNGQTFWAVNSKKQKVALDSVDSFLDEMGQDHCVYYASVTSQSIHALFVSANQNLLTEPTSKHNSLFYKLNTSCVELDGVYIDEPKPECRRPQVMAISDVNNDGNTEYWATQPYIWDDGVTIWGVKRW